jgi:hypothetical protein
MSKNRKGFQAPNAEQRAAILKYQKDFAKAAPAIVELARDAKGYYDTFMGAPNWAIRDNPKPDEPQEDKPELWTVGHAQVNYVDHIKTTNDEGAQDK